MASFRRFYRPPSAAACQEPLEAEVHGAYKKKVDPSYMDQEGRGPLHLLLLMEGDEAPQIVEHVIRAGGCSVDSADRHGARPLTYAARQGAVRCLKVLLAHGAQLDEQDSAGDTALMVAAAGRRSEALELLLRAGAAVHVTNQQGENALHRAVAGGCEACVRSLLKHGCRINQQDVAGRTALHVAAQAGDEHMLHTLLTAHCHGKAQLNLQDTLGRTALHWTCCQNSNPACLALLLRHGPPYADTSIFDKFHNSPVLLAVKANQVVQLQALLSGSARRVTIDGRSPVAVAALRGYQQCVRLLLDAGLDPNHSGHFDQTPLTCAAFESHTDIVELLLSRGANPNGLTDTTALFAALSCISPENAAARHTIVARLLSAGADPNIKFARSWYHSPITQSVIAAFSLAFDCGYVSLVRMLLTAGCSVTNGELSMWANDPDHNTDAYSRDVLMQPIKDLLSEPLSLSLQIRRVIRKHIAQCQASPACLSQQIKALPIAPRLISFLLLEELFEMEPELAPKQSAHGAAPIHGTQREGYHPFRGMENCDLYAKDFDSLLGTYVLQSLPGDALRNVQP